MDKRKEGLIPFIEKKAGFKFERVGAPQPADMARIAGVYTTFHLAVDLVQISISKLTNALWIYNFQHDR